MSEWLGRHILEAAFLLLAGGSTLIQIAPVKLNPWTALARWLGRAINGETLAEMHEMKVSMDRHIMLDDERYAKQCRMRILRFNDELLQKARHTKEHFDEILDDITEYERYCEMHPGYRNSKANMAIANVETIYQQCLAEKNFL